MPSSARRHAPADDGAQGLQELCLLRSASLDYEGGKSAPATATAKPQTRARAPATTWPLRCGTPFGRGYSAIAYAYKHKTQGLTPTELQELTGPLPGTTADVRGAAAFGAAYVAVAEGQPDQRGGARLHEALSILWGCQPLVMAALEFLTVVLEVAAVVCLGAVIQDIEHGVAVPVPWLEGILGEEVAGHAGLRTAPLVVAGLFGPLVRQLAQHRRAQAAIRSEAVLRGWAFRAAACSSEPAAPPLAELLQAVPALAGAWARRSRLRAAVHALGAALALVALLQALGLAGLVAAPTMILLLSLEALAQRRSLPWRERATELRAKREVALRELLGALAMVKAFAWERLYFRCLALLRGAERRALHRASRHRVLGAALWPELLLLLPGAAALLARWRLGPLGLGGGEGSLRLWQAFQALAACHVLAEQLGYFGTALGERWPGESAQKLEVAIDSLVAPPAPPLQGSRSSYKASKYAVKVEGMRFFWPDAASPSTNVAKPAALGESVAAVASAKSAQKAAASGGAGCAGLELVDDVTDDASVAERARRAQHGALRFDLKVLSFQVKRGAFVALAGATGCGKSTLLEALLGACRRELWGDDAEGSGVALSGRLAYVPQRPQLLGGRSVRDNVLCGLPVDMARYERVLAQSTLAEDLKALPQGDASDVSELREAAARMCLQLARALYVEAEIMLLDDPFVAMERDRAKRVMSQCVKALVKQRERTVVLATQSLSLLREAETVVVLRNGTVFEQGDYKTLASMPTEFSRMLLIANKKESERALDRKRLAVGVPCPFLSYEVDGADPMREAFPLDAEWEAEGYVLGGGLMESAPANSFLNQRHQAEQAAVVPATPRPAAGGLAAPLDTQRKLGLEAGGVALRGGAYKTVEAQPTGTPRTPGKAAGKGGKEAEQLQPTALARSTRERKGGATQRRRGFALDAPAAKQIQDYFGAQEGFSARSGGSSARGSAAGAGRSLGAGPAAELGELFATRSDGKRRDSGGGDSARRRNRSAEAAEPFSESTKSPPSTQRSHSSGAPGAGSSGAPGGGAGLFGGDFGIPGDGVGLYGRRLPGTAQGLPQLPELEEALPESARVGPGPAGAAASALESFGDLPMQQRAAVSASGVPAVGASEMSYVQRPVEAGASSSVGPSPRQQDFSVAEPWAGASAGPVEAGSVLPPSEDLEAGPYRQPDLRPDALHGAPPPPRDESPTKTRGSSSKGSKSKASNSSNEDDPRLQRLDALEKALKEKNKQIAELERQMAVGKDRSGGQDVVKTRSGPAAAPLELAPPPASAPPPPPPAARARAPACAGAAAAVLLRTGGLAGVALAVLFLLCTGLHLSAQYALGHVLHDPSVVVPATTTATPSAGGGSLAPGQSPSGNIGDSGSGGGVGGVTPFPTPPVPSTGSSTGSSGSGFSGNGVWIGFSTLAPTGGGSAVLTTTTAALPTTTTPEAFSLEWALTLEGQFCREDGLDEADPPAAGFSLDANYGWYFSSGPVLLEECKRWCEGAASWGCRFISWGRMGGGGQRWCYLHRDCVDRSQQQWYQVSGLNATRPGQRRLQLELQAVQQPTVFSQSQLPPLLVALCVGLALAAPAQALAASSAALTAGQEAFLQQLRAALAAGLPQLVGQEPWLRARLIDDVAMADEQLPWRLGRLLAALAQVLAAIVAAAVACGRQAVLAVTLVLASGLAIYLHRMRLPLLAQLRKLRSEAEAAAELRLVHLVECHGVLRAHGRLEALCDEFEGLCGLAAQASLTRDMAERWLYTRLHILGAAVLGVLAFSLLAQGSEAQAVPAAAALLQAALLPAVAAAAARQGAGVTEGLAALRRARELKRQLPAEELESPLLRLRAPSAREEKDVERGKQAALLRGGEEDIAASMYDLSRLEREQTMSVDGFPLERVADDWPYFGAVDFEDVTLRYAETGPTMLQGMSLSLPASSAMLVVGQAGSGKSALVHALLRLGGTEAGRVVLDCVDSRSVGLTTLRSRVALVPQDVPLFGKTWRDSLDPMAEFSEHQMRLALRLSRLQNWLAQHAPRGLDEPLPASMDPALRALLGLCRALLRLLQKRSKLLVMDCTTCRLSTSSDADITMLILRFCRRREAAVLQLSQRVNQAHLYDEVAVLHGGHVVERGPAKKLWSRDSALRRLGREQGLDSSKMTKPQVVADRLASMVAWDMNPQEDPEWSVRFSVALKKPKKEDSGK